MGLFGGGNWLVSLPEREKKGLFLVRSERKSLHRGKNHSLPPRIIWSAPYHIWLWVQLYTSHVTNLVGEQHARHRGPVRQCAFIVKISLPLQGIEKRAPLGEVKHDDAGMGILVVHSSHGCKTFLA